jgi:hypothetical protein
LGLPAGNNGGSGNTGNSGGNAAPVIVNGATVAPAPSGGVIINGQTAFVGGPVVTLADGTPVSVGQDSLVFVGGSTATVPSFVAGGTTTKTGTGSTTGTGSSTSSSTSTSSSSTSRGVGGAVASGIGIAPPANDAEPFRRHGAVTLEAGALLGLLGVLGIL